MRRTTAYKLSDSAPIEAVSAFRASSALRRTISYTGGVNRSRCRAIADLGDSSRWGRVDWCVRSLTLRKYKPLRPHPPIQRFFRRRADFLLAFNWAASIAYLVIPRAKPFVQAIGKFSVEIDDDRLFPVAASDVSGQAVGSSDHCIFEMWHRRPSLLNKSWRLGAGFFLNGVLLNTKYPSTIAQ